MHLPNDRFIIAIDGPSATGKTTISKALAQRIKFPLLLTGKIYRAFAKRIIQSKIDSTDTRSIIAEINCFNLSSLEQNLDGEEIAKIASIISSIPEVRKCADQLQYDFMQQNHYAILEGRDIGTVICPKADLKIFLTASPEVRAQRRLGESQLGDNYEHILKQIIERDHRDATRNISPLIPAHDAIIIDNSNLSPSEQLDKVLALLPSHILKRSDTDPHS